MLKLFEFISFGLFSFLASESLSKEIPTNSGHVHSNSFEFIPVKLKVGDTTGSLLTFLALFLLFVVVPTGCIAFFFTVDVSDIIFTLLFEIISFERKTLLSYIGFDVCFEDVGVVAADVDAEVEEDCEFEDSKDEFDESFDALLVGIFPSVPGLFEMVDIFE
ncbi:unnamed protein product [[Candida] boidinii]|nr:unnamed protein product [[Candida] boidinii]